jgi:hypothetical protein
MGWTLILVASLIRQESEFNPTAISHANAYGLMQLLPSVGKQMAREEGMGPIEPRQLLDPILNIRLGRGICVRRWIILAGISGIRTGCIQRRRESRDGLAGCGAVSRDR